MTRYLVTRIVQFIPLLVLISVVGFAAVRFTGDPLAAYLQGGRVTPEVLEGLRARFGLDRPPIVQYGYWLAAAVRGDLGFSIVTGQPVLGMIAERLPNSALLLAAVLTTTLSLSIPIAIYAATRPRSIIAHAVDMFAFLAFATPTFWLGIMLILLCAVQFKTWGLPSLPPGGMYDLRSGPTVASVLRHLVLPTAVLSLVGIARYSRFLRASLVEVLREDYIRTAQAKGVSGRMLIARHAAKNAAPPVVTVLMVDFPQVVSFAIVTEQVYSWPGVGQMLVQHAFRADYPLLMGLLMVTAVLVIAFNLLADVLYAYLDPRIRYGT
jgi:peptide/nickel transport system permease protein